MTTPLSLPHRMLGVLHRPRTTFEALAVRPQWADVLAVTFLLSALATALVLETDVGQLALLDQLDRTATAFGQPVDATRYAALAEISTHGVAYAVVTALAGGPLLALALSAVLVGVFRAPGRVAQRPDEPALAGRSASADRPGVMYRQVLAIVSHTSVVLALRQVVAAPAIYARETLASPLTLSMFVGMLDAASPLARFAAMVDLFVIWWVVVLAVGMSVLYRRPAVRLALVFAAIYIVLAGVLAVVMGVAGRTE